jgi:hypothetical protein
MQGLSKFRTGKGAPADPTTIRVNEYYASQRQTCIELIEDIINVFYDWNPDQTLMCERIQRDFRANKRIYTNNNKEIIRWICGRNLLQMY